MIKISFDESTNKDLLKGTAEKVWDNTDTSALTEYKSVFNVKNSGEYETVDIEIAGLEHGGAVADGAATPTYDPLYGSEKKYVQARYGSGFTITMMMKKFNRFDTVARFTRNLKRTMAEMKDETLANIYNTPTATTYASGFDSAALLSATHANVDASQYSNYATADLTETSYLDAYLYFDTLVDSRNKLTPKVPDLLVVPPALQFTAKQLNSDKVPFEISNTDNVIPGLGIKMFKYHRMTDTDSWYMLCKNDEDFGVFVDTSMEADIKVQDAPDTTRNTYVTSNQLFTYGIFDPRMVYGSVPA